MTTTSPSPFEREVALITAGDDEIRAALDEAELPPLLPALAYVTGDLSILRDHLRPDPLLAALPQGGFTDQQQDEIRDIAAGVLAAFRDGGSQPAPAPSDEDLLRIMEFAVGGEAMREYLPLLEEELAHGGEDRRAPTWRAAELAPGRHLDVVVIGAGMSGLLAACRLQQVGIAYTVLERSDDVGGTWHDNTYPGCRVDNPNHNYSYSFAQRHDWPLHYSTQDVLWGYFRDFAEVFGLREHIRFGTEVLSAVWSDDDRRWTLRVRHDGVEEELSADAVVSAVGQLNQPLYPETIDSFGSFEGPAFHSARWDHTVDLAGKRVAVIGTGASAVQIIPAIAEDVGELVVLQRTPPWLAPTPDYHDEVGPGLRWLYAHVPSYSEWNRFWIFWRMGDGVLPGVRVDPAWMPNDESVSELNDLGRLMLVEYLREQFGDRPDLLEKVTPHYPVGAKRGLRDNGVWAGALKRDNVRLVTTPIAAITPKGVLTTDGDEHVVDVVIYGTGFRASKFLTPMTVTGRGGLDLHEQWHGDARAYLGVLVPGFPNLFCLYGPNTNIVINGSIVYFSECGVRFVLDCLRLLHERDAAALTVRQEVHDDFNAAVDAENRSMAWGVSTVNSWYKNETGRVAQNWPFTLLEYWRRTKAVDPDDVELIG
jgi:4-hydroxyacetophenone monooxygenase